LPALWQVQHAVTRWFSGYRVEFDVQPPPRPRIAWAIALALMALSLLGALWRTRQVELSPAARIAWVALCGLVGLPALMALWLLYPPRERLDEQPLAAAPATA